MNTLEKEFIPYEQALELKELGFDEPCLGGYIRFRGSGSFELAFYKYRNVDFNTTSNIYVSAPTFSQAFRWFREKHKIYSTIIYRVSIENDNEYWDWLIKGEEVIYRHFKTYEEAELACLRKLIEICSSK